MYFFNGNVLTILDKIMIFN